MTFEDFEKKVIEEVAKQLRLKQNALLFDNIPTDNSVNPVTSAGIKDYADAKLNEAKAYTDTQIAQSPSGTSEKLVFEDLYVNDSSWIAITTPTPQTQGYSYYCDLDCPGITSDSVVIVMFSMSQATSGNYAPVCHTISDGVRIYAKELPNVIPNIIPMVKEI